MNMQFIVFFQFRKLNYRSDFETKIFYVKIFNFIDLSNSTNSIETIPELIKNEFAYGFDNLTLKARFDKTNYKQCNWVIVGKSPIDLGVDTSVIFNSFAPCGRALPCYEEDVASLTYINTNLTISNPIDYSVNALIACDDVRNVVIWNGFPKSKFSCFVALLTILKLSN